MDIPNWLNWTVIIINLGAWAVYALASLARSDYSTVVSVTGPNDQ